MRSVLGKSCGSWELSLGWPARALKEAGSCWLVLGPSQVLFCMPIYIVYVVVFRDYIHFMLFFFFFFFWLRHKAWWILVPWAGIKPTPLHWKRSLNHWTTREVPRVFFSTSMITSQLPLLVPPLLSDFLTRKHLKAQSFMVFSSLSTLIYWWALKSTDMSTTCKFLSLVQTSLLNFRFIYSIAYIIYLLC